MSILTTENYINACAFVMAAYGLQFLIMPAKIITDHFKATTSAITLFTARGTAGPMIAVAYAMHKMQDLQFTVATIALIAFLYPFNAKYGIFQKLKCKYPMHYVPEGLMTTLITTGIYLLAQ
jgi:hypothetical protein|tara:strand:+ start:735 stop:1100 length:366 start_codon:yes stop_codon:yes gene_type:complete